MHWNNTLSYHRFLGCQQGELFLQQRAPALSDLCGLDDQVGLVQVAGDGDGLALDQIQAGGGLAPGGLVPHGGLVQVDVGLARGDLDLSDGLVQARGGLAVGGAVAQKGNAQRRTLGRRGGS